VALLGQGATGRTFKLEQLDGESDDPIGTFVGKAVFNHEIGERSLSAYKKVRSFARHDSLSDVLQTNVAWSPDELMALLRWTRGEPLDAWRGETQFLAENAGEADAEALLLRWFSDLCAALDVLHAQRWVHGDVSPSNILLDDDRVVLIDYDLAGPAGEVAASPGTVAYCSPERRAGKPARPSDDLYALATSLFHVLTDRIPLADGGDVRLPWTGEERARWPRLSSLLDIAVNADPGMRFEDAGAAQRRLRADSDQTPAVDARTTTIVFDPEPLRPNVVARVKEILSAYPGSRFGNAETRGLDTDFASDTYVETGLDGTLREAVKSGAASLVILCGNAGDGKTAFLQHLVSTLVAQSLPSSQRVWEGQFRGRRIKVNLDGAASWKGRSADDLLDDFFAPFHQGSPSDPRAHLVAVNDGRLMEWVESYERRHDGKATPLTLQLAEALGGEGSTLDPHVRLIELNQRSLVGGVNAAGNGISAEFVDKLVAKLVGGEAAPEIWRPCRTCTARARCPIRVSAELMGASIDPLVLERGRLLRKRLTIALQAVHQRNEVHITARELKAAISYILFGLYSCDDIHRQPDLPLHAPGDHAFDPLSDNRQGELLRDLARLDPGLEAHARVDRYLSGRGSPDPTHGARRYQDSQGRPLSLRQARRRAYFDWSADQIAAVGGESGALGLNEGRRYAQFRNFPFLLPVEKQEIKRKLCEGLSRLEVLPDAAFLMPGVVPIRIVPRTPTETSLWVSKPLDRFELEPEHFEAPEGLETLHRYLALSYQPLKGPTERLTVSLELYALLMDLEQGVQILDSFSDDVFANLGVFTERVAQEDERSMRGWNPADETHVYEFGVDSSNAGQTITLKTELA
jgi:serine/threonine protein kinase